MHRIAFMFIIASCIAIAGCSSAPEQPPAFGDCIGDAAHCSPPEPGARGTGNGETVGTTSQDLSVVGGAMICNATNNCLFAATTPLEGAFVTWQPRNPSDQNQRWRLFSTCGTPYCTAMNVARVVNGVQWSMARNSQGVYVMSRALPAANVNFAYNVMFNNDLDFACIAGGTGETQDNVTCITQPTQVVHVEGVKAALAVNNCHGGPTRYLSHSVFASQSGVQTAFIEPGNDTCQDAPSGVACSWLPPSTSSVSGYLTYAQVNLGGTVYNVLGSTVAGSNSSSCFFTDTTFQCGSPAASNAYQPTYFQGSGVFWQQTTTGLVVEDMSGGNNCGVTSVGLDTNFASHFYEVPQGTN